MSHIPTNLISATCAAVSIVVVGCGDVLLPQQPAKSPTRNVAQKTEDPVNENERISAYVTCRARFTAFEKDYSWFEDSSVGHDDGKAPLASFVLLEPASYSNRAFGILFKYATNPDTAYRPDQADIGSQYTFQVPADFLSGNHKTLDNTMVRRFQKVDQ